MVGDRILTDVAMSRALGMTSILVLSGATARPRRPGRACSLTTSSTGSGSCCPMPEPAERRRREPAVIEFVFMLTHHDRTVDQPLAVYAEIRDCGLRYVGFKDIGATAGRAAGGLRAGARRRPGGHARGGLHQPGRRAEVDRGRGRDRRRLGARRHPPAGRAAGARRRAGTLLPVPRHRGRPSRACCTGEIGEIAASARAITALDGVYGLDLLAYRHPTADVAELTRAVVQAASRAGDRRRIGRHAWRRSTRWTPPAPGDSPSAAPSSRAGCRAARRSAGRSARCCGCRRYARAPGRPVGRAGRGPEGGEPSVPRRPPGRRPGQLVEPVRRAGCAR